MSSTFFKIFKKNFFAASDAFGGGFCFALALYIIITCNVLKYGVYYKWK